MNKLNSKILSLAIAALLAGAISACDSSSGANGDNYQVGLGGGIVGPGSVAGGSVPAISRNVVRINTDYGMTSDGWNQRGWGSGTVTYNPIDPNDKSLYVVTADHVVRDGYGFLVEANGKQVILGTKDIIPGLGVGDQAFLRLPANSGFEDMVMPIGNSLPTAGTPVLVLGYPGGNGLVTFRGIADGQGGVASADAHWDISGASGGGIFTIGADGKPKDLVGDLSAEAIVNNYYTGDLITQTLSSKLDGTSTMAALTGQPPSSPSDSTFAASFTPTTSPPDDLASSDNGNGAIF